MWDPISLFYCMWILNTGLPEVRLSVQDVVKAREQTFSEIGIREGIK